MEFKPEFEELRKYYEAFWNCEVLDRVAVAVTAPKSGAYQSPKLSWSNPRAVAEEPVDRVLDLFEEHCRNIFYGGLAAPFFWPNFGPDVFSGFLGVKLNHSADSETTSWANWTEAPLKDYSDLSRLSVSDDNALYRKGLDFLRRAIERGRGRYLVGLTDLHGGFDALSVLRGGPDRASMDLIEHPEGVKQAMGRLYEAWQKVYDDYVRIVGKEQSGTISWINIYAPGKMYPVQNDFSCLVSPRMYQDFFLEELLSEIEYLDQSIYHLDGMEALQHLDILLDIPRLNAIQWVCGARFGNESIAKWFPLFRKIQAKKKAIVVYPKPEEVSLVLENLKPEGLLLWLGSSSEEEARSLLSTLGWGK